MDFNCEIKSWNNCNERLTAIPHGSRTGTTPPDTVQWHAQDISIFAQSAEDVEYTDCISAERYDSPNECPDITLNNLMVRLQ